MTLAIVGLLLLATGLTWLLGKAGRLEPKLHTELNKRTRTWYVIVTCVLLPMIAGPSWTIAAVAALSIFCFSEFARATGLVRERLVSTLVTAGIVMVNVAAYVKSMTLFQAIPVCFSILLVSCTILSDRPNGFIQRVGLGLFGFLFFGYGFGFLSLITNVDRYRSILLMLILAVELNDVFAYLTGKLFGRRKMSPNTSPNKTLAGGSGALVLTTLTVWGLGSLVFKDTGAASSMFLIPLGMAISIGGQLGDLMLSAVKRDIGIKDLGNLLPGHGGLLDRFDSLVLVSPLFFYFIELLVNAPLIQPIVNTIVIR
jgi:phosphatidate cytidylyltransferase